MKYILKDPLVYFLLAGVVLFLGSAMFGEDPTRRILLTKADQIELAKSWQSEFNRLPTPSEFDILVERWVTEELAIREAMAMELDKDDPVVRRRLVQKLGYLIEARSVFDITDADLAAYHEAHASRYVRPAKVTFTHHFFSTNRRESAFQDAQAALIQVSAGQDVASDSFIQHRDYVDRTHRQISEVFGSDFADQVLQAAPGQGDLDDPRPSWVGPFQSSYGYHLVALQGFDPGGRETFDEAYDRIVIDYETDLKSKAKDQFFETLLTEYDVVRE